MEEADHSVQGMDLHLLSLSLSLSLSVCVCSSSWLMGLGRKKVYYRSLCNWTHRLVEVQAG